MKDVNVEIVGQKAKTFYEFIVAHNSASDGQRLGQRFVNIFISQPWPKLFYEQSDKEAMKTIEKWLTDHHYYPKMPPLRKQK